MKIRLGVIGLLLGSLATTAFCDEAPKTTPSATKPAIVAAGLPKGVKAEKDIEYIAGGGAAQSLDLYLPEKPADKPQPLIVWIHGGGWQAGNKNGCPAVYLVPEGYVVASVEYRFSQKAVFPAQAQDCHAAIRWLRANAKKYNIDTDHVGVWGASAGGHLVALLGTAGGQKAFKPIGGNEEQSDRVQCVVDWFGPKDFHTVMKQAADDKNVKSVIQWNTPKDPYSSLIGVKLGEDEGREKAVSPITYVSKESAPILIMHGTADALVPFAQSEAFVEAYKKAGAEVLLQKFNGAGHGGPAFSQPAARDLIKAYFDKHLKGADVKIQLLPEDFQTKPNAGK